MRSVIRDDHRGPQRKSLAGPMAPTSVSVSRKSFAVTNTYFRNVEGVPKETVSVHTSAPQKETRSETPIQQIYDGPINVLSVIDTTKVILCCKFTEDTKEIAGGFADGAIRLFDCSNGECTHFLTDEDIDDYPGPVTGIKHRPVSKAHPISNTLLATYVNGFIKCWQYKYDQCLYTIREKRQTLGLTFHPRLCKFVSYGDDGKLNLYDEEAQVQERSFFPSNNAAKMDGHSARVFATVFSPRSNHELISGGWDNTVMCWDDRQPYATRHFFGPHLCGEGLDFNKSANEILTCAWQDKDAIQLWDYRSCKLITSIKPDNQVSKLYCGKFVPQTNLMLCGGSDNHILRLVDMRLLATECSIKNNPGGIYCIDFGQSRRKVKKTAEIKKTFQQIPQVPRVAFVTGKRLMQIDFG